LTADLLTEPRSPSPQGLAILRHPDRKTTWVQVIAATLSHPVPGLSALCDERLEEINEVVPIVGARLGDGMWVPGKAPRTIKVAGEPLDAPHLLEPFTLASGPPIRVLVSDDGRRVALVTHHAAADGRSMVGLLHASVGGPIPRTDGDAADPVRSRGGGTGYLTALRRVLWPADRVPPSPHPPPRDSLAVRTLASNDRVVIDRIASAAIEAIAERSRTLDRPWRRVGLSIPVGSTHTGIGNHATYRRVDLRSRDCSAEGVRKAIFTAIKAGPMPTEFRRAPRALRLLSPISDRFSDSVLISNHGRYHVPGISQLDIFPVARGRSAVVFGAARVEGGASTLALRARDLTQQDAEELLDRTIERLEGRE
jgi:hypothetical protein